MAYLSLILTSLFIQIVKIWHFLLNVHINLVLVPFYLLVCYSVHLSWQFWEVQIKNLVMHHLLFWGSPFSLLVVRVCIYLFWISLYQFTCIWALLFNLPSLLFGLHCLVRFNFPWRFLHCWFPNFVIEFQHSFCLCLLSHKVLGRWPSFVINPCSFRGHDRSRHQ